VPPRVPAPGLPAAAGLFVPNPPPLSRIFCWSSGDRVLHGPTQDSRVARVVTSLLACPPFPLGAVIAGGVHVPPVHEQLPFVQVHVPPQPPTFGFRPSQIVIVPVFTLSWTVNSVPFLISVRTTVGYGSALTGIGVTQRITKPIPSALNAEVCMVLMPCRTALKNREAKVAPGLCRKIGSRVSNPVARADRVCSATTRTACTGDACFRLR
jgi:hypothetical protein